MIATKASALTQPSFSGDVVDLFSQGCAAEMKKMCLCCKETRGAHLVVSTSCPVVGYRSLGGTHNILVPCFSVLATSISRQFSTPPSAETYCQYDSIHSSLLVTYPFEYTDIASSACTSYIAVIEICRARKSRLVVVTRTTYEASY